MARASIVLAMLFSMALFSSSLASRGGALETAKAHPAHWAHGGRAAAEESMNLVFALSLPDGAISELETQLLERSTRGEANYGKWLSWDAANRLAAPSKASHEATRDALLSAGVAADVAAAATEEETVRSQGGFVTVDLPVAAAEKLLGCEVHSFHNVAPEGDDVSESYLRCAGAHALPAALEAHVDFVGGATGLPTRRMSAMTVSRVAAVAAEEELSREAGVPAGNGPLSFMVASGKMSHFLVIPRCSDGSFPTTATCTTGAGAAVTVGLTLVSGDRTAKNASSVASLGCGACSALTGDAARVCGDVFQAYSIPAAAAACAVDVDTNQLIGFNVTASTTVAFANGSSSDTSIKSVWPQLQVPPMELKETYGVPVQMVGTNANNSQAVAEFLGQYYSDKDLQQYLSTYGAKGEISKVVGPNNVSDPGGEASLDVQVILGVASSIKTEFWSFAGLRNNSAPASNSNQEPFLRWMLQLASTPTVPFVHSISYDDDEDDMPQDFTDRLNTEFMRAGVRGITLLFAAGDDGVGGETVRENGTSACPVFHPAFPSSSPWVTAVGGTQFLSTDATGVLEECVSDSRTGSFITTGGGFSGRYPAPAYQQSAVQQYFKATTVPPLSYFNASGRGFPDISGVATNYPIIMNGEKMLIGGTSASTPLVAAMVSLINDARLNNGDTTLGFLNPSLYQLIDDGAYNDVTTGNNKCSAVPQNCCEYGFDAAVGWDPTSGLGSPFFSDLIRLLVN